MIRPCQSCASRSPCRSRARGGGHEPDEGAFPERRASRSSTWSATTWRSPTARCAAPAGRPNVLVRYANGDRRASSSTRSARRPRGPPGSRSCTIAFPVGPHGRRGRAARRRRAGLDGESRLPRAPSAPGARRRPRPSRRAARRSRSGAGRRVAADRRGGAAWCARRCTDFGLVGLAEDLGLARHARQRAHRAALDASSEVRRAALALAREVERRAPAPRDQPVVEGGAPRRLPRLQPERQGPHRRERLLGPADAGRARLGARSRGRSSTRAAPEDFTLRTMPARFAELGDRHAGIDGAPGSLDALLELSRAAGGGRAGDAPWPPHYAKQEGEPTRVAPSRARTRQVGGVRPPPGCQAARSRSARARTQGGRAGGPGALEGAPSRGRGPSRAAPTCWSTPCAAGHDLDAHSRQPGARAATHCGPTRSRSDPAYDPWRTRRSAQATARAEDRASSYGGVTSS